MDANATVERGVGFARSSPGGAAVAAFAAFLLLDLVAKLAGVALGPFRTPWFALWFGGEIALGQVAGYVWNGVVIGAIIGLASIGLSLTYSILNFANFAHGDYLTAGAFSGWAATYVIAGIGGLLKISETAVHLLTGLGAYRLENADLIDLVLLRTPPLDAGANIVLSPAAVVIGLAVAAGMTIVLALVLDRLVYRPMRNADGISLLIASIGVAFVVRYLVAFVFGNQRRIVTSGDRLPSANIGGVVVDAHEVTLLVTAGILMFALHVLLQRTKLGKAMRAMADNRALAQVTGIPTERVIKSTWLIGAGMTGAAGFLLVLSQGGLGFQTGWLLLLLIFAAVIMGGIGSIYGAIAGGLLIGLASRVSLVWLQGDLASFARPAAFALMILVLLFRPSGIFGGVKTA